MVWWYGMGPYHVGGTTTTPLLATALPSLPSCLAYRMKESHNIQSYNSSISKPDCEAPALQRGSNEPLLPKHRTTPQQQRQSQSRGCNWDFVYAEVV